MVTACAQAQTPVRGTANDKYLQGGLQYRIVHISHHAGRFGHTFFATQTEIVPYLFIAGPGPGSAAPGMFIGLAVVGGAEHMTAGHFVGPASHPVAHAAVRVDQREASISQPTAPGADESDQEGAATAQPDPTASPVSARPPGVAGPGRPVSGWSGPGLPGPGRPASPGW
jgi:hypothetical protein